MGKAQVNRAYLVLMQKDGEFSFLIVVDFTRDRKETFDGIAAVAVPLLKKGECLDMLPLAPALARKWQMATIPSTNAKQFRQA